MARDYVDEDGRFPVHSERDAWLAFEVPFAVLLIAAVVLGFLVMSVAIWLI